MKRKDIAKAVALLLSAAMLAGSLTGCGSNADSGTSSAESASDAGSASEGTDKEDASTQESAAEDDTQEGSPDLYHRSAADQRIEGGRGAGVRKEDGGRNRHPYRMGRDSQVRMVREDQHLIQHRQSAGCHMRRRRRVQIL